MKQIDSATYIQMRLLVGYLGEKSQHGWWATEFLSPVAKGFLEPSFPRTWRVAQYTGVTEAARRLHDDHIGIGNVFHLFRLPEEIERQLHAHVLANPLDDSPFLPLQNREAATEALDKFVTKDVTESKEGPASLGKLEQIRDLRAIGLMASHYGKSFKSGTKVFPYFAGNE